MLVEGLKAVTESENRAEEIRADANTRARQAVIDARKSGEEQTARMLAEAEKISAELRQKSEAEAEKETAAARRRAKADCDELRKISSDNIERVADIIIERVVSG